MISLLATLYAFAWAWLVTLHPVALLGLGFLFGMGVQFALCWYVSFDFRCIWRGHHWGDAYLSWDSMTVLPGYEDCYCCGERRRCAP